MHILAIVGSLQAGSSNEIVVRAASTEINGDATVTIFPGLGDIPPFRDHADNGDGLHAVSALRHAIATADGVLIVTPEYAHSLPGVLKNALDWLVGGGELANKPIAIITAFSTPTGAFGRNAP